LVVGCKCVEAIEVLANGNADLNRGNIDGDTPFHYAVRNRDLDTVQVLLHHGADPNRENNDGKTPCQYAIENGSPEIVQLLLQHINLNEKDKNGMTPLHWTAKMGAQV